MSSSRLCSEPSVSFNVDKRFDVFLSFRGSDTREGFVKLLYAALDRERTLPFFDEESLRKGDHIPTVLTEGVTESRIGIPIFSENFAESKWCLREVSLMVKSGVKIRPLFYGVSPKDLHCPHGSKYAEHLKNHESDPRLSTESILEWKGALETVANIPGWCSSDYSGDHDLIQDVVVEIRKILHSNSPQKGYLDVPKCFGLDRSVKYVKGFLDADDHHQKMVKLGIHGMSGIGKTTLAKIVFRKLFSQFEAFSFVPSVGERCQEADGLLKLQTQMLKDVSHFRGEVGYVDQGKGMLQDCLRGKKVLLVLDDIQSFEQFDALGGNYSDFGAGSRLIITSQNLQILKVANVDKMYQVRSLPPQHALRLFKFHAFPDSYRPDQELETLCNDIVTACEGLPLALQIFGKLLAGKEDRDVWKEIVGKLKCEPNMQKKLIVSYDALDRNEKEMFLDIACFVAWTKKKIAMIFWAEVIRSSHVCLRSLLQKSFVELGPGNELLMHRCLRDLGRSIAGGMCTETPERTRLVDEEDVPDVLCRLGDKANHLLYLSNKPKEPMTLKAEMFKPLYNLRLLWLTDVAIRGHFSVESSLEDLRWLRLRRYSSKWLPQGMNLQNLVILEVTDSQITHLWNETEENPTVMTFEQKRPGKLKVLILRGCGSLESLPATLCHTPLQILDLHNCHLVSSLPDSIGSWTSLVSLDMEGCSVSSLPQDFGELVNLQELNISCCKHLSKLPASFGNLSRLEKLEMHHNSKLTELPDSFGGLETLTYLDIEGCSISSLPQDFGKLANLEELNLSWCQLLSKLPTSFGNLARLERLEIHHNSKLTELPNSFGDLKTLAYLDASYCRLSDNGLPPSISELSSLKVLHLEGNGIHRLPGGFEHLIELHLDDCSELSVLSALPSSLQMLFARNCISLHTFCGLPGLPNLLKLDLSNSCHLTHFDGLQSLQQLTTLNLVGCNIISCETLVSSLSGLTALESIYFGGPGVSSAQLHSLYDSFKVCSFSEKCFLDNLYPTANWLLGEAVGKYGYENKCIDFCADANKEYCAGYIACLLSSGQIHQDCEVNPANDRLSYTIERDESSRRCPVKHQSSTKVGGDILEVRFVRADSSSDFPWLKSGNKLRINAVSDYENWKVSYKFLMYETHCATSNSEKDWLPKMITFVM